MERPLLSSEVLMQIKSLLDYTAEELPPDPQFFHDDDRPVR